MSENISGHIRRVVLALNSFILAKIGELININNKYIQKNKKGEKR